MNNPSINNSRGGRKCLTLFNVGVLTTLLPLIPGYAPAAADMVEASRLYKSHCAVCHGAGLRGGRGPALLESHDRDRDDIIRVLQTGASEQGMPAFGQVLTEKQIDVLTDFIRLAHSSGVNTDTNDQVTHPLETLDYKVKVEIWADNMEIPWGLEFINADTALLTERPGRLRKIRKGELKPEPVSGTPEVYYPETTQGGLLDLVLDPEYEQTGWIYLSYSHALSAKPGKAHQPSTLRVVRGRIRGNRWVDQETLFEAAHETYPSTSPWHYGGRLTFGDDGFLYISIGDRYAFGDAQSLRLAHGKIHRIGRDGSVPENNPYVGRKDTLDTVFSYGHRNPQGLALHPVTGELWSSEHGPQGGDELNIIVPGANFGWPEITYGIDYDGSALTPHRRRLGMVQPILYWRPSIAVSGMTFYSHTLFPRWQGKLLVGALKQQELRLLDIEQDRVMHQEVLMKDRGQIREVMAGPDGAVYLLMHEPGRVLRLTPDEKRLL